MNTHLALYLQPNNYQNLIINNEKEKMKYLPILLLFLSLNVNALTQKEARELTHQAEYDSRPKALIQVIDKAIIGAAKKGNYELEISVSGPKDSGDLVMFYSRLGFYAEARSTETKNIWQLYLDWDKNN